MNSELRDLLDRIYEMEGLVHLAILRDDSPNDFIRLIAKKGEEINRTCKIISGVNLSEEEETVNDSERVEEHSLAAERKVTEIISDADTGIDLSLGEYSIEEGPAESDDNIIAEITSVLSDEENSSDNIDMHDNYDNETDTQDYDNNDDISELTDYIYENDEEDYEIDTNSEKEEEEGYSKKDEINRGKLIFSLNDKYRFRKELFDNSDIDFNNSVAIVASMDSFEEAEDYFLNDVGMNPSDSIVKDFLEVIKRYFR